MPIEITVRHMNASDAVHDYARRKAQELVDEFSRIEHVHVILDVENRDKKAEVVIQGRNHIRVEADDCEENLRAALDRATEKAARQMRRLRDKVVDHKTAMKHEEENRTQQTERDVDEENGQTHRVRGGLS